MATTPRVTPAPAPAAAALPRGAEVVQVERVENGFKLLDVRDGKQWVAVTAAELGALIETIFSGGQTP